MDIFTWKPKFKHGHAIRGKKTGEYRAWVAMLTRCNNQNNKDYPSYGGRGIRVAPQWLDFAVFLAEVGPKPEPRFELDRLDNDGNYEPGNVAWRTRLDQIGNRRNSRNYTFNGETKSLKLWCKQFGVNYSTALMRLRRGLSFEAAIGKKQTDAGI